MGRIHLLDPISQLLMERGRGHRWALHRGLYGFDLLLYVYAERLDLSVGLEHGWKLRLDRLYVELEGGPLLLALYLVYVVESLRLLCTYTSA
jgi:hypothetical protein